MEKTQNLYSSYSSLEFTEDTHLSSSHHTHTHRHRPRTMSLSHCKDEEAKRQGIVTYLSQMAEGYTGLLILRPGFKNNKE